MSTVTAPKLFASASASAHQPASSIPPKKRKKSCSPSSGARSVEEVPARCPVGAKRRRQRASPGIKVSSPIVRRPQGGGIVAHLQIAIMFAGTRRKGNALARRPVPCRLRRAERLDELEPVAE